MSRDIFSPREHLKPFEYPEALDFVKAINHSYWLHTEWNFTQDIHEFHKELNDNERAVITRCMLLISQIEVGVKLFWQNLNNHFPKPEINALGVCFGESEIRHMLAYSELLEKLGLNDEFEKIYDIPAIIDRHNYLKKYKEFSSARIEEKFLRSLILFSLFIENVSLFSQFYIIMSFNKHKKKLKDINNVVAATSKEEKIHASAGLWLINILKEEHPEFFTDELKNGIINYCKKAYKAEEKVLDWIFENGDLDFMSRDHINEFVKNRMNDSLEGIGIDKIFDVDEKLLEGSEWFDLEITSDTHVDFFSQRPTSYSKFNKSFSEDELF
jgi:ribonucleoside-diphosphate reductase beta chain